MESTQENASLPLGMDVCDTERLTKTPAPGSTFLNTITILETGVRRITVHTDFLLSYLPLRAGCLNKNSEIKHLLVPRGSVLPEGFRGRVHWLPPIRTESPVPSNTYRGYQDLTLWHFLAVGLFPPYLLESFLEGVCEAGERELHRDLWEYSGDEPDLSVFSPLDVEPVDTLSCWLTRLPESDRKRILRHRTPLELCLLVGEPLFSGFEWKCQACELPRPVQEMIRWSASLTRSRRLSGRNGLG